MCITKQGYYTLHKNWLVALHTEKLFTLIFFFFSMTLFALAKDTHIAILLIISYTAIL